MKLATVRVLILVLAGLVCVATWAAGDDDGTASSVGEEPAGTVVAYYFHGNARCATCRKIEAYSEEAIKSAFQDKLVEGRLEWRVVNVDQSENKHFVRDFQLVTKSVVLVEYGDGEVVRWENLQDIWQLVRNKDRFVDYVQSETRKFLGEG
jgi:hypothetical protein